MDIKCLGACCSKSRQNYENTVIACKNLGITDKVQLIGDMNEIVKYGVMSNPSIVVNGKVVSTGKLLTVPQIETLIKKYLV